MTALVPVHSIAWREGGFGGPLRHAQVRFGATIAEMVFFSCGKIDVQIALYGDVCINGHAVPRGMWTRVRTRYRSGRQGPIVVTLHRGLRGGNTLSTALSVAGLVAAIAISGGALAPLAGPAFAAGSFGAGLLSAGVPVAGRLAISEIPA